VYCQPSATADLVVAVYDRQEGILIGVSEERTSIGAALGWVHFRFKKAIEVGLNEQITATVVSSQITTAQYTSGSVVSVQYAGTYYTAANSSEYIGEAEGDQYGPPARIDWADWTAGTRNYSIFASDYLRTLTNTAVMTNDSYQKASGKVGYGTGVEGGCPLCGSSEYE